MEREELLYALNEAIEERQIEDSSDQDVTIVETAINILNEDADTLASYNESEQLTILEAAVEVLTEADRLAKERKKRYYELRDKLIPAEKERIDKLSYIRPGNYNDKYFRMRDELKNINRNYSTRTVNGSTIESLSFKDYRSRQKVKTIGNIDLIYDGDRKRFLCVANSGPMKGSAVGRYDPFSCKIMTHRDSIGEENADKMRDPKMIKYYKIDCEDVIEKLNHAFKVYDFHNRVNYKTRKDEEVNPSHKSTQHESALAIISGNNED